MLSRAGLSVLGVTLGVVQLVYAASDMPEVPGFSVEVYATADYPIYLSFEPGTGVLYAGHDAIGTATIHRIEAGGSTVGPYGDPLSDPDAVIFDELGNLGVPGAVIVGGVCASNQGCLWAIHPDESVQTLSGPTDAFHNPAGMAFDHTGRLIFADYNSGNVMVAPGGADPLDPDVLFSLAGVAGLVVDDQQRIVTGTMYGTIHIHDLEGNPIADPFVSDLGDYIVHIAQAPSTGPFSGTFLYATATASGSLLEVDECGNTTTIGTGFETAGAMPLAFGPDEALYISEPNNHRILRISAPAPCPADLNGDGVVNAADLAQLLGSWGPCE